MFHRKCSRHAEKRTGDEPWAAVKQAAVFGTPHPVMGEVVQAVVTLQAVGCCKLTGLDTRV